MIFVIMVVLSLYYPDSNPSNIIELIIESLAAVYLSCTLYLWFCGFKIISFRWDYISEVEKIIWIFSMIFLVAIVGYILWILDREPNLEFKR
ncbi:MAG: hypothetical protein AAF419_03240, partial [Pseudomonadota bacterium]